MRFKEPKSWTPPTIHRPYIYMEISIIEFPDNRSLTPVVLGHMKRKSEVSGESRMLHFFNIRTISNRNSLSSDKKKSPKN